ncbi:unnamed protein product, partial [Didymodactylos carnosus]
PTPKTATKASHSKHTKVKPINSDIEAFNYLGKYGYNRCGDGKHKEVVCAMSIQSMLQHFQTVFHLPVTGKLDDKTKKLMNTPRCGLGDYPLSYSAYKPWPNRTLTWKLKNELPKFGSKSKTYIQEAFNDWTRYAPIKLQEICSTCGTADFNLAFTEADHQDGYPFDGPGGTLAHAFFPTDGNVHFDSSEEWTDKYDGFGYNLRLVASHEIGHALGLAHSYDQSALMYPFYQLMQPGDLLPKDDRDGIRALYGNLTNTNPSSSAPTTSKPIYTTKHKTTKHKTTKHKTTKHKSHHKHTTKASHVHNPTLEHNQCARYLDAVLEGKDQWLYTLDYNHVWRYHPTYKHWDTRGIPLKEVFPGAEGHMMAGIMSPATQKIYLFKGYRVWRFTSSHSLDSGFPKRLHGHGTPFNPVAALYDEKKIWLIKGDLLFPFDETKLKYINDKPPKRISEQFPGIPRRVRTAFTYEGKHYFFIEPNRKVYVFNQATRRLDPGYPRQMETGWFACTEQQ